MQTSQTPSIPAGVAQIPLLTADQLVEGAILTGPAWLTVRQVRHVQGASVMLMTLGAVVPPPGHIHQLETTPGCPCGYLRTTVKALLPISDQLARTYILVPTGPLMAADPYTVYVGPHRQVVTVQNNAWTAHSMPVIPMLHPVWRLPDALRALIQG